MAKKILQAVLVINLILLSLSLQAQKSNKSFIHYTINGKTYNIGDDEANCYYKSGERQDYDKVDFEETTGYSSVLSNADQILGFTIRTKKGTLPVVGSIPLMGILHPTKQLPSVRLYVDKTIGEEYEFFSSVDLNKGKFEITKVDGEWIEGIFEADIPNTYDEGAKPIKITNGSFRLKMDEF